MATPERVFVGEFASVFKALAGMVMVQCTSLQSQLESLLSDRFPLYRISGRIANADSNVLLEVFITRQ
jgi:hypothetical protein